MALLGFPISWRIPVRDLSSETGAGAVLDRIQERFEAIVPGHTTRTAHGVDVHTSVFRTYDGFDALSGISALRLRVSESSSGLRFHVKVDYSGGVMVLLVMGLFFVLQTALSSLRSELLTNVLFAVCTLILMILGGIVVSRRKLKRFIAAAVDDLNRPGFAGGSQS